MLLGLNGRARWPPSNAGIRRHGTGFLMRARDLGLKRDGLNPDELVVVTNHHVVNEEGSGEALRPESAEVVFEALSPPQRAEVAKVLWSSPPNLHDACVLQLQTQPAELKPLTAASALPVLDVHEPQRVYVIGHPGGRELAFSLQDNELLDMRGRPGKTRDRGSRAAALSRAEGRKLGQRGVQRRVGCDRFAPSGWQARRVPAERGPGNLRRQRGLGDQAIIQAIRGA
jgi:S1-C subfamily serine protease